MISTPWAALALGSAAPECAPVARWGPPGDRRSDAETPEYVRVDHVEGISGPPSFETPTFAFVPSGTLRVTTGARVLSGVTLPASGLAGDLSELGMVRIDVGFGSRIQVRIQGALRQHLRIDAERSRVRSPAAAACGTTHGMGGFSVVTIAKVMPEKSWRPAVGQRVEANLPNTDEGRGIRTNVTDVLLFALMHKQPGEVFVVADVGLGIRAVRTDAQTQDDVLLYDVAAVWKASRRRMLSDELVERWAPTGGHVGTGDRPSLMAGIARTNRGNSVGLALSRGLLRDGEDLGVMVAVSRGLRDYNRVRAH